MDAIRFQLTRFRSLSGLFCSIVRWLFPKAGMRRVCKDRFEGSYEPLPLLRFKINTSPFSLFGLRLLLHEFGDTPIVLHPKFLHSYLPECTGSVVEEWRMSSIKVFQVLFKAGADLREAGFNC